LTTASFSFSKIDLKSERGSFQEGKQFLSFALSFQFKSLCSIRV